LKKVWLIQNIYFKLPGQPAPRIGKKNANAPSNSPLPLKLFQKTLLEQNHGSKSHPQRFEIYH
jgi:hypothetical protein